MEGSRFVRPSPADHPPIGPHGIRIHLPHHDHPLRRGLLAVGQLPDHHELRQPGAGGASSAESPQRPDDDRRRFNDLAHWGQPGPDRYTVELEIVSVAVQFAAEGEDQEFPLLEVLDIHVLDRLTGSRSHRHRGEQLLVLHPRLRLQRATAGGQRGRRRVQRSRRLRRAARQAVPALPRLGGPIRSASPCRP